MPLDNWPIDKAVLRKALKYKADQGDDAELDLYAAAACELIDEETGRDQDPTLYVADNKVPNLFVLAARETAKLWWQQSFNAPQGQPEGTGLGVPMGAALPSKVAGWLDRYLLPGTA